MNLQDLHTYLQTLGLTTFIGYPPTGARPPYVVVRPMSTTQNSLAVTGQALDWDVQYGVYCVGGSVEASMNQALAVVRGLDGYRVNGVVPTVSIGYTGALLEGQYESQVTIQVNQGVI